MKKFHIAISVKDITASIADYSARLGAEPEVIVTDEYALWRTDILNFSIRRVDGEYGQVRHVGWEDDAAKSFTKNFDGNGILWENFNKKNQRDEINSVWPDKDLAQT